MKTMIELKKVFVGEAITWLSLIVMSLIDGCSLDWIPIILMILGTAAVTYIGYHIYVGICSDIKELKLMLKRGKESKAKAAA